MKRSFALALFFLSLSSICTASINIDAGKIAGIRDQLSVLASENRRMSDDFGGIEQVNWSVLHDLDTRSAAMVNYLDALTGMLALHRLSRDAKSSEKTVGDWVKRIRAYLDADLKYLNRVSALRLDGAVLTNVNKLKDYLRQTDVLLL